jgi:flagellar motor switch protein FliG
MKPIEEMTGTEKAAALLIALGPAVAAQILQHLDEESINKISLEISRIEKISVGDREELIGEFLLGLRKHRKVVQGGENVARELLNAAFGEEKASQVLKNLTRQNLEKGFEYLKNIDSSVLVSFLQHEHPQTIAVAMAYLPPQKSAEILQELAPITAKEVALRMARMDKTSPEAVLEIARVIRRKYEESQAGRAYESVGGIDTMVSILNYMSGDHEKRIMGYFDAALPVLSQEIRDKIYTFENVANLTNQEMRLLIDEIDDDILVAKALKGAGDEIRFKFLRNMSRNRATDILTEIDVMGPTRLSEIQEARDQIAVIMRDLNESGLITLRKEKEKYVE